MGQQVHPTTSFSVVMLFVCLMWPMAAVASDSSRAAKVGAIETDVGNLENSLRRLEGDVDNPVAKSVFYPMEKRLVDARVYFELKNYDKAAVLYMDAIRHAQFRTHPDRFAVIYRLSYSLFRLKNYLAARVYLNKLVKGSRGTYYPRGLALLIEIGLESPTEDGLEASVQRAASVTNRMPYLQYAYAKGIYRLGRTGSALTEFSRIPATAPEYIGSQYYIGVIYTERKKWPEALSAFSRATKTKSTFARARQIREFAHLSLGRVYLEQGKFTQAINAYQEIDRKSEHFHTALYEMTWAYINTAAVTKSIKDKHKEYNKALNALEILRLTVEDDQLQTRADILRGRLNMLLNRTDVAEATYSETVKRFAPIRDELDRFAKRKQDMKAYFRWLLNRHSDAFQVGAVLSKRAARWLETDESLGEVVGLFNEMSKERKNVRDAKLMVAELEAVLNSGNRVEIFPDLKSAWTRIVVAENNLIEISQRALDLQGGMAVDRMSAAERNTFDALRAKRLALEKRFAEVPKTEMEINDRQSAVQRRFSKLKRDVFLMETSFKDVMDAVMGMEKWLQESRYSTNTRKLSKKEESVLRKKLNRERSRLRRLGKQLTVVKNRISRDRVTVGAGDFVSQNEAKLKEALLDAHRKEQTLLNTVMVRLAGEEQQLVGRLKAVRVRIVRNFNNMGELLTKIQRAVDRKVVEFKGLVNREKRMLAVYVRKVKAFDRDSDQVARDIGVPLFKLAYKRIGEVVLDADLGLVDMAWKRKTIETDRIRVVQKEQADQMRNLESTIKAILAD